MSSFELEWVKKVYSDGLHNAFTGLAAFKENYYLAFRNAEGHVTSESFQIIMKSNDGKEWQICSKEKMPQPDKETTIDYRDSYLLPDGDNLVLFSICTPVNNASSRMKTYSQLQLTTDGNTWSKPLIISSEMCLWKPVKIFGKYYCAAYSKNNDGDYHVDFMCSDDRINWTDVSGIAYGSEAHMYQLENGRIRVFVRPEKKPYHLEIYESSCPFAEWEKILTIPKIIQGYQVFQMDGKTFLAGRERPDYMETSDPLKPSFAQHRTKIWKVEKDSSLQEVAELPSKGDNAYPGVAVLPDNRILISYYSQHETGQGDKWSAKMQTDIFVALLKYYK